jgi:hypothetical protein
MTTARDRIIARLFSHRSFRQAARRLTREGRTSFLGMTRDHHYVGLSIDGVQDPAHGRGVLIAYLIDDDDRVEFDAGQPATIALTRGELAQLGI